MRISSLILTIFATSSPITAASRASPALRPKIEPNNTFTFAAPFAALRRVPLFLWYTHRGVDWSLRHRNAGLLQLHRDLMTKGGLLKK